MSDARSQPRAKLSDREEGIRGYGGGAKGKESEPTPRQEAENYQKLPNGLWVGFLFYLKARRPGLKGEGLRSN